MIALTSGRQRIFFIPSTECHNKGLAFVENVTETLTRNVSKEQQQNMIDASYDYFCKYESQDDEENGNGEASQNEVTEPFTMEGGFMFPSKTEIIELNNSFTDYLEENQNYPTRETNTFIRKEMSSTIKVNGRSITEKNKFSNRYTTTSSSVGFPTSLTPSEPQPSIRIRKEEDLKLKTGCGKIWISFYVLIVLLFVSLLCCFCSHWPPTRKYFKSFRNCVQLVSPKVLVGDQVNDLKIAP